jgi:transglutaminase-like putative cysteine protease
MGSPFLFLLRKKIMRRFLLILVIVIAGCNQHHGDKSSVRDKTAKTPSAPGILYSNPRVYNVDYSFEMVPDPNNIDRAKDLKVWIPIPREWDSQKAVKIISVEPEPHARYVDPEYGNPMLFWDFDKEPEQSSYKVDIKFRLESYAVSVKIDPDRVGSYEKTSKEYAVYNQSTHTISIMPEIRELARAAIGDEKNPYLQAKRIIEFTKKKVRFKLTAFERGRGIKCLLDYPVIDEKTGQEYYEGACNQYCALFVALCRAVGIPARCVSGYVGWNPLVGPNDVKAKYPFETKLSPEGLAATQLYGGLGSHMWGEFFIPNYGWIPTDPQSGTIGHQNNRGWIKYKARDIQLGPHTPQEDSEGYGVNWVALHKGRADSLCYGALNIAKIRNSKVTVLHHSDPFPADALAGYPGNPPLSEHEEEKLRRGRENSLSWLFSLVRTSVPDDLDLEQFYKDHPLVKGTRENFTWHMLRRQIGNQAYIKLVDTYINLRQKTGQPVSTSRFQELAEDISGQSLDWFFNQWLDRIDMPRLKLEQAAFRKDKEGWQIRGRLLQSSKTIFRLPVDLALDTENGREMQNLWMDSNVVDFDFRTLNKPRELIVDPNCEIFKLQKMAPCFPWFWEGYPQLIIVYGTLGETEANKAAAERFNYYIGVGGEVIKADTDVNEADLKTKCIILIGRPETNRIAREFKDNFPIKFHGAKLAWQGITYDKQTQAVAQIVQNPRDTSSLMIMNAGLSPEATRKFPVLYLFKGGGNNSYIIFDGDKQLLKGAWEDVDSNLYWSFDVH